MSVEYGDRTSGEEMIEHMQLSVVCSDRVSGSVVALPFSHPSSLDTSLDIRFVL